MQFKFKDLIITSLENNDLFSCDAGEGTGKACDTEKSKRPVPPDNLSFEDLQDLRLLLRHTLSRLDIAISEYEMRPKSVEEIEVLQERLAQLQE